MRLVAYRIRGDEQLIPLAERPDRVWYYAWNVPITGAIDALGMMPLDQGHDWSWRTNGLRCSLAFREPTWLLLQYGETGFECAACKAPSIPLSVWRVRYCPSCGVEMRVVVEVAGEPFTAGGRP